MLRTLVVPLDGTAFGEQAVPAAAAIAPRTAAQLHPGHVGVPMVVGDSLMQYTMIETETPQQARDYLADVLQRVAASGPAQPPIGHVLTGPVTDVVHEYARAHAADLVVMTTHGHGPMTRAWL